MYFAFQISELCVEAVKKLFKQDKLGYASLGVVKVISGLVRGRNYDVRPEVRVFLLYITIFFSQKFKKIQTLKLLQLLATDKQNFLTLSDHRQFRIRLSQGVKERYGAREGD